MKTLTAIEAIEKVQAFEPDIEIRDASALKVGQGARQGDLYLVRVNGEPDMAELRDRQLVRGSTRGSRHVVEGDATIHEAKRKLMPKWVGANALLSPVIVVGKGGAVVTHPEHAHVKLPPNSTWATWQQMDARTLKRVQD
jgi:hypothetical protein